MFNYGSIGILLIVFNVFTLFIGIHPFDYWYPPINWLGFILFFDYVIYKKKDKSLLHNSNLTFQTFLLSVVLWLIVDLYNFLFSQNWYYINLPYPQFFYYLLSVSLILPSIVESIEFTNTYFPFKLRTKKIPIPKKLPFLLLFMTIILFFIITFYQLLEFTTPLLVVGLFLFSDSLNFLLKKTSFINDMTKGNLTRLVSSLTGGYILGIFWELFNVKYVTWVYNDIRTFSDIFSFVNFKFLNVQLYVWIGCGIGYLGLYSSFLLFKNLLGKTQKIRNRTF